MPTLTKTAVDWIASQKGSDKPFFLYFPWTSPHAPIVPTPEWKGRTQAGPYGDYMAQSDWTAGEVLKALKENGFAENTIVIFSADNGPEHFAYDRAREKGHRSMGEFRGLKRDLWEGGHRVPFTVRWPRVVPKGSVSDGLLSQTDLFATLATAIGAKLPPQSAPDSFNQLELWKARDPAPAQAWCTILPKAATPSAGVPGPLWMPRQGQAPEFPKGGTRPTASMQTTNLPPCTTCGQIPARSTIF
ncbi:sulfatase-like hydrolase/transferase [Verrucomicrobium spinosum]|uniref:sulfatase-like hydrolase/transferase n=1 Tax=Verrucomicrobium spinosum TaxID=2736 RepID=UPI000A44B825|nr:sulfatase-like hydrolase/transferase [Verrucomicrobium spinosum]